MRTVVLVTCTSAKHKGRHAAGYIYTKSSNFRKYMELAHLLTDSKSIFVISALHGLLPLDTVIDWYDYTLMGKSKSFKDAWGIKVAEQIRSRFDVNETKFIVLAGADYFVPLIPHLPNMEVPLKGVSMGHRPAKVEELIKDAKERSGASTCYKLHNMPQSTSSMSRASRASQQVFVPRQTIAPKPKPGSGSKPTYTRKYAPLTEYLSQIGSNEIILTLSEIEKIIGAKLPPSAYKHEVWWANNDETHTQRLGWTNAGFEVTNGRHIQTTYRVVYTKKQK